LAGHYTIQLRLMFAAPVIYVNCSAPGQRRNCFQLSIGRSAAMIRRKSILYLIAALFLFGPLIARSQDAAQSQNASSNLTLVLNGQSDQPVPVMQTNGHAYVELGALAHAVQGTLSFRGNRVELTLPGAGTRASPSSSNQGFSKGFLRAAIEFMGTLREWRTALATAIQNSFPLAADWLGQYRMRASDTLRLAGIAASTDADRNAYQLLGNESQNMSRLSDKYLAQRANLTYIAQDALENDDLNQRIVACGHALGAMAGSGQFVDDPSCH
jgi:hypothetical protein